jgi:tetratricopeptide (TPR) repeat protein
MDAPSIFVSHSHKDDEFGVRLIADLRARLGEDAVWYDSSGGLHGGDEWWNRIVAEITARSVFIAIFSPDSVNSKWVIDELNIAWANRHRIGTRIIPVIYRPCDLRADWLLLHQVSFIAPRPYDSALAELLQVLDVPLNQVAQPSRGPTISESPFAPLIARLTQDIHTAFGQEEWNIVVSKAKVLLSEAPQGMSPALWRELGLAYVGLRDGAAALPALEEALKADQYDASALRGKGLAYALVGDPANAIALLDRAYTLAPFNDNSLRLSLLGDLYRVLTNGQRWEDALRRVQDALHLAPGDPDWLDRQLEMLGRCERHDDALLVARGLVSARPSVVQKWVNGRLARDREDRNWGDALRVIDLGLETAPNDDALLSAKLEILTLTGKEGEALRAASAFASQNRELVDDWLRQRFAAHRGAREWKDALDVAEVGLQVNRADASWWVNKTEALRSLGKSQDAYAVAEQASRQFSSDAQVWISLAAAAKAIDNEAEVRRAMMEASRLAGENSPAVRQAGAQYQEPYDKIIAQREQEERRIQEAARAKERRAEEAERAKERRRRAGLIWLAVSVVLIACIGLATLSFKIYQGQQTAATQTATAKTAIVGTAVATAALPFAAEIACLQSNDVTGACAQYYGKPYTAVAPGSCDKGGAKWTPDSTITLTCDTNGTHLSKAKSGAIGSLFFHPTSAGYPNNYELAITISDLVSNHSCAGVETNQQTGHGGFGFWVCYTGDWAIIRYDSDSGAPHTVLAGTATSATAYNLTVAVVGDAHIMTLSTPAGGSPVVKVYYDLNYPSTDSYQLLLGPCRFLRRCGHQ